MASAKFANSTVSHSQPTIWPSNNRSPLDVAASMTNRPVTRTAPTSTTNMTGFRAIVSGFSFHTAPSRARRTSAGSQMRFADERDPMSEHLSLLHQQVLDDRPQAEGRKE